MLVWINNIILWVITIQTAPPQTPPDIVLLDIKMPDIDGYQVCSILKADEETSSIPIIFLSGLNEVFDKVKAFQVGGVDYITKPFQTEEFITRIQCIYCNNK